MTYEELSLCPEQAAERPQISAYGTAKWLPEGKILDGWKLVKFWRISSRGLPMERGAGAG
jgi:hypothetical protein